MKKFIIPAVILVVIVIFAMSSGGGNYVVVKGENETVKSLPDSFSLNVYVENSGSMDGYMGDGSELKDAVYDYISAIANCSQACDLNYVNAVVIPYSGSLESYIRDLTPESFRRAGGNRANTDLRDIFSKILAKQDANTVSVLISDCILDISGNATSFFGNCQISMRNTFTSALKQTPHLGVQVAKLNSKFDGMWYCGKNKESLTGVKRPYYIWVIGDVERLAKINKTKSMPSIMHGIESYCAFAPSNDLPFEVAGTNSKNKYSIPHTDAIDVNLKVDMGKTLQEPSAAQNMEQYSVTHSEKVEIKAVRPISDKTSPYSHVVCLKISQPKSLSAVGVKFANPYIAPWVEASNDDDGVSASANLDKTTGIKYLINGVAEAYKDSNVFENIKLSISK